MNTDEEWKTDQPLTATLLRTEAEVAEHTKRLQLMRERLLAEQTSAEEAQDSTYGTTVQQNGQQLQGRLT
eukprot:COSAG06_NODE_4609_length_4102_cov_63.784911_4_plen_70_part_00